MGTRAPRPVFCTALALVFWSRLADARPHVDDLTSLETIDKHGLGALLDGWRSFGDVWLLVDMVTVLLISLLLGAVIAYHPAIRRRLGGLEDYEQPKTILMYAVVAAVVALIVEVQPAMAFVIFGIGGLLRFRTLVGEAKETGRVILVTVIGLCVGLKIFVVAVPATVVGWLLILVLEREAVGIIRVSGVGESEMREATRAYRAIIAQSGFTIIGEQTRFIKREFLFVVKAPAGLDRPSLEQRFDAIPAETRGVVDFERI